MLVALLCYLSLGSALPSDGDLMTGALTLEDVQKRDTSTHIAGVFRSSAGDGIKFKTSETSMVLTTVDEQTSLVDVHQVPLTIQSYRDEGKATYFKIMDEAFITSNKQVYRIRGSDTLDMAAGKHTLTHSELLASVQGKLVEDPQNAIRASVQRLVEHPAIRLLEPAARALAEELGVSGREEPAVAPFFAMVMRLTEVYEASKRSSTGNVFRRSSDYSRLLATAQGRYPNCDLTTCPPCQEDECMGMCGRLCTCWIFMCGDCCLNRGCELHDVCCREKGFYSAACLFPVGFSCKRYSC